VATGDATGFGCSAELQAVRIAAPVRMRVAAKHAGKRINQTSKSIKERISQNFQSLTFVTGPFLKPSL
jgi:hypothetical protein